MNILDKIKQRIQDITNPEVKYTQQDFDNEFANYDVNSISQVKFSYKTSVNFTNKSKNQDPEYATDGSSGFDLRADLSEPFILKAGKIGIVPTGLYFELPDLMEIQVRPRSGLAAKNGVTVLNTPGTVDSDYRGEIKVILINHSDEDFVINNGDRIAQGVIASVLNKNVINLNRISEVSNNTNRGDGGFGSTGVK